MASNTTLAPVQFRMSEPNIYYAMTRHKRLYTPGDLAAAEVHGKGLGATAKARRRPDAKNRALALAKDHAGKWFAGIDHPGALAIRTAYRHHMERHNATTRKSAPIGAHLLVMTSPGWLKGDPHDPHNPHVKKLTATATDWVEKALGGVFAARYDIDETGSAVVDVFIAPVHKSRAKNVVSTNKALEALRVKYGREKSYQALQDSWAEYAQRHLDPLLLRGRPETETQRKNVTPEVYKEIIAASLEDIEQLKAAKDKLYGELRDLRTYIKDSAAECLRLDEVLKKKPWASGTPPAAPA